MIGAKPKGMAPVTDALARLDFSAGNAELERLRAELANVAAKDDETRQEAQRLANEVRDFSGPAPDAVAVAILAGKSLADAAAGAVSREQLAAQRDALMGALEPLRQRAEDLRGQVAEIEGRERAKAFEALASVFEGLMDRQRRAAAEIVEVHAALVAIAEATGRSYMPEVAASKSAVKGVLGGDNLLGWRTSLPVPAEVREALKTLAAKSRAVRAAPDEVSTRYL